jgi:formylglycine-generating enzyme required for sulfatase activity
MLLEVKRGVSDETNGEQRPWSTDDLTREFYFAGVEGNPEDYIERPSVTETTFDQEATFISDDFILVEGGTFSMGSNDGADDEQPVHNVKVSSFYMGRYEVTNQEVVDVFTRGIESGALYVDGTTVKYNYGDKQELLDLDDEECQIVYSRGRLAVQPGKENNPVIEISWYGILVFCNLLSEIRGYDPAYNLSTWECDFTSNGYRLPTEAEWEYAAKGGNNHDGYTYSGSNTAGVVGWHSSNSGGETHPVGGKTPNSLGLYDMSGNVWEWCFDRYGSGYYSNTSLVDPEGPGSGSNRVLRGGSWNSFTKYLRCADRDRNYPTLTGYNGGFRVVVSSF